MSDGKGSDSGANRSNELSSQSASERERHKLRLMLEQVQVPLTILEGPNHRYAYQNSAHRELFFGGRDLVGLTVAEASPESVEQGFPAILDRVYQTGETFSGKELPLKLALEGGKLREFFVHLTFQATRNEMGEIDGIVGSAIDVTKEVEQRYRHQETESYFRNLIDNSPAMIWMTDEDSSCVYLSKRWYEYTGRTPEQDLKFGWLENIHPDDLAETARVYAHAVTNKGELRVDYRLRDRAGNYHWTIDLGYPRFDAQGKFLGYIGTVTDIHERIAAENELKLAKLRFERSAAASGLGIWYCDLPFDELTWNSEVKDHFWLPPDARVTIETFYERIHLDDREPTREAIARSNEKKSPYDIVYRTTNPLDEKQIKYIRAVGWTDFDQDGRPRRFDGLTLDMTADKEFQEELKRAKVAAETANTAKSAFLANMSHEIRTPLGAILGFTELLRDTQLSQDERAMHFETIARNGRALTRIIDDILDLAKVESGKLEIEKIAFSLSRLLNESIELFQEIAKSKNLFVQLNVASSVPDQIVSDPTRLRQIILNLLGNAVKFTAHGGVTIDVSASRASAKRMKIEIKVTDTGVGIARDKQDRLFKPFAQADTSTTRQYGGTGLGLVVSSRLASALHGSVRYLQMTSAELVAESSSELKAELTSELNKKNPGSVFVLEFEADIADQNRESEKLTKPGERSATPAAQLRTNESSARDGAQSDAAFGNGHRSEQPLKNLRILVVDDSSDNRALFTRILAKAGAETETANNGEEATGAALASDFALILMDIQMPVRDGYEATRLLRASDYKRPIVALTAHAMAEDHLRSKAAGCDAHLTKPVNRIELLDTILRLTEASPVP